MNGVSAVVITKNEADNISACVQALLTVAEEVLVVDSGSQDDTVAIAKSMGARVLETEWLGYAQTKNLGNQAANYPWILSIDADEVLSPELVRSLKRLKPVRGTVYELDRLTNYCGKWIRHSGWYPDWKIRLFHRDEVKWQGDYVHETLQLPEGQQVVRLAGRLYHYSYKSSEDHWARIRQYAQLSALDMQAKGKKATLLNRYGSPLARYFRTLLLKQGFRDGLTGFRLSTRNAYLVWKKYQLLRNLNRQNRST